MGKYHWKVEKQPEWYVKAVRKTIAALPGGYAEAADWLDVTENALFNRLRADGDQIFPLGWAMVLQRAAGTHYIADGFVAVFNSDESSWHLVEDHRGKTVYDVASGDALFISELGPLAENVTWLSPEGEFQKWNGTAWVKDTEAEKLFRIREAEEKKTRLIQEATDNITILQDAVNFEMATDEEVSMLSSWKKYRVLVSRIDINTAPDIVWPEL